MGFRQAACKIDVVIVGGGICGLACAFALGRSGHRVRVLERSDGQQHGAGIRMPPNLTKLLAEWGLEEELKKCWSCRKSTFMSLESDPETIGILEWQEDVLEEAGGQFLLTGYDEFYQILHGLALSVGAEVIFNSAVTGVETTPRPLVRVAGGTTYSADLIIGADGDQSMVREVVTEKEDQGTNSGHTCYTVFIPVDQLRDPDLAYWATVPQWPIGVGDNRAAFGFFTGKKMQFSLYWPDVDAPSASEAPEGWDVLFTTKTLDLASYDNRIQRLFNSVPTAQRRKYVCRERVEDWVDHTGRILLVGEAAHPSIPHNTHATSMAIEDAEALGVLMSHLGSMEQIPQLTAGFQELRKKRCDFIHDSERSNVLFLMLPAGEMRDRRDASLRESLVRGMDSWNDEMLRKQWENVEAGFAYHVREAAEDWWRTWGSLANNVAKKRSAELEIPIQIESECQ
ncbi:3-hydroxybenzoate 6-hydroxylase 1 [Favolaschia claudopus]|uniref:3-hydroxybenzoate 6-hydroxylase 1 n=1 Tax=Favolaschia claudopus TaxID=2862362 RepID=A0AAW0DM91_9AGAR